MTIPDEMSFPAQREEIPIYNIGISFIEQFYKYGNQGNDINSHCSKSKMGHSCQARNRTGRSSLSNSVSQHESETDLGIMQVRAKNRTGRSSLSNRDNQHESKPDLGIIQEKTMMKCDKIDRTGYFYKISYIASSLITTMLVTFQKFLHMTI